MYILRTTYVQPTYSVRMRTYAYGVCTVFVRCLYGVCTVSMWLG